MKNQILISVISISSILSLDAQVWTPGSNFVSTNGNVGIGINSPIYKLDLQGSGLNAGIHLRKTDAVTASWYIHPGRLGTGEFSIGNDNFYAFTILPTGNVGIGTTSPYSKLSVSESNKGIEFTPYSSVVNGCALEAIDRNNIASRLDINLYTGNNTSNIKFYTAAIERMRISPTGNVGIGTTNPDSRFKLDVEGTIRASELKVCIQGGCDFVFRSDYKLMDLNTLEQFVKTNQHLPEIAPEKDMIENGVNMKEMQMKFLQKMEEMTLYLINQNKEIESLKQEVTELKKK